MVVPNLFVAAHTLVNPSRWFNRKASDQTESVAVPGKCLASTEHWKSPVPGIYQHKPGAGWFLIQRDGDDKALEAPDRVLFCAPLDRGILESSYRRRSTTAKLPLGYSPPTSRSSSPNRMKPSPANSRKGSYTDENRPEVSFVRHDDGITWLNDKDAKGKPTKGPWQRFFLDKETGEMRVMLKGDDPNWRQKVASQSSSRAASEKSRPSSLKNVDGKNVASNIRALAPELDGQPASPGFLEPRSLVGSARSSPKSSPSVSRKPSLGKMQPDKLSVKSPLASPSSPQKP